MAFPRAPLPAPARPRGPVDVFAVGRRVYIAGASAGSARATLTDSGGRPLASLPEGAEVTVVAWRPGWSGTTRYCVRVSDSELEGWLPVGDLRGTRAAIPSPPIPGNRRL